MVALAGLARDASAQEPEPPDAVNRTAAVGKFLAGAGVSLAAHEGGHLLFDAIFDADPGIRPSYRQFTAYAAPWEPIPDDGLPRYPERRPS